MYRLMLLEIRLMLLGMLNDTSIPQSDKVDSVMRVIDSLIEGEIDRRKPTIRKFRNLPDYDIVLTAKFWELLKEGDLIPVLKHLRSTNDTPQGHPMPLEEARVLTETLYPTV